MVSASPGPDHLHKGEPLIGVLALQGSFPLHIASLERCGARTRKVRKPADLQGLAGLVIPGGESTTMENLALRCGLFEALGEAGRGGLPIFGTCAGAILLGKGAERPGRLELVDVEVRRNAYGRQVDSFSQDIFLAPFDSPFHCVFIRAPIIEVPPGNPGCEVLGKHDDNPVLVRNGQFLLATFHPELTSDLRVHKLFLQICGSTASSSEPEIPGEAAVDLLREKSI
ncbi:MAG: pyridoxal 5'-phosphate synthase glutaminase subunit PdxT [Planctomycetota bacterium]|nr:pyridoxal 5'-phosphate synthase glutaminase subunit PdxT [Planctomycetota bacterium]MEE3181657.1 pyridoxal 5'-phosphate synthase glutaminase subunit PdxT [Planctomycetota bacterium]MEE3198591.1 pyridoxal 5'-phosphate synthase glutaminase subunit PdxT [Planctomycetota bacterium]